MHDYPRGELWERCSRNHSSEFSCIHLEPRCRGHKTGRGTVDEFAASVDNTRIAMDDVAGQMTPDPPPSRVAHLPIALTTLIEGVATHRDQVRRPF